MQLNYYITTDGAPLLSFCGLTFEGAASLLFVQAGMLGLLVKV